MENRNSTPNGVRRDVRSSQYRYRCWHFLIHLCWSSHSESVAWVIFGLFKAIFSHVYPLSKQIQNANLYEDQYHYLYRYYMYIQPTINFFAQSELYISKFKIKPIGCPSHWKWIYSTAIWFELSSVSLIKIFVRIHIRK